MFFNVIKKNINGCKPESANSHIRPLRDKDDFVGSRSLDPAPVHRPQPGQDPEQRGLPAPVRSGYQDVLARLHLECSCMLQWKEVKFSFFKITFSNILNGLI